MRPLSLELEGFGPYRERQRIEFADVELFALTGPTGAGKTTILDAIAFALYAKTPRGFKKYSELVYPGLEAARVRLVFQVGGEIYQVTRVVGAKSEHRLERQEGGVFRVLPESEKVRALNERIERLLGLSFDAFTRAILLPQGAFDRFLKGEPKERKALLAALFGLETLAAMRDRARGHREAVARRLERIEGELAGLASGEGLDALKAALAAKRSERERLERELEREEKTLARLEELASRFRALLEVERSLAALEAQEEAMRALAERLDRAERAARLIPDLRRLEEAGLRATRLKEERSGLETRLQKLRLELDAVAGRADPDRLPALVREEERLKGLLEKRRWLDRLGPPAGPGEPLPFDPIEVQALLEARRAHAELDRDQKRRDRLADELAALRNEIAALAQRREALVAEGKRVAGELEAAEARLKSAEVRAGLAAYHQHLRPGEPCPLCGQEVRSLPPRPEGPGALDPLRSRVEELRARVEELRARYRELDGALGAKREREKQLAGELADLEEELARRRRALPERAEVVARLEAMKRGLAAELAGEDPATRLERVQKEEAELRSALERRRALEGEVRELEQRLAGVRERADEAERSRRAQAEALAARLAEAGFKNAEDLRSGFLPEDERSRLADELERYRRTREEYEARRRSLKAELGDAEAPEPGELGARAERVRSLKARLRQADAEIGELTERLRRLEDEEKRRRALLKERAALERELAVWEQLTADLRADRFPEFLIDHYQKGLVARASEILAELYQNRYRLLAREGDYYVEDTWTRGVRPVRTLSGGESFLASLALALALSEHLSQGRLGALFLDEGFGALDRETLAFAASVLETLPTRGRLVGIVTHVAELAERIPDRLVVEKSPSGSRVRWAE